MSNQVTICSSSNRILAGLLSGDSSARPNVMYVEFQSGTAPVTNLPVVDPTQDDYYLQLREDVAGNRDFLRIPIAAVTTQVGATPDDLTLFFNGICAGTTGVGGKSTSDAIIYGIALANSPTFGLAIDDLTRDRVWARGYFSAANQMPFSQIAQTMITFKLNLK